jgi:tRNA dimethylallyltransferase
VLALTMVAAQVVAGRDPVAIPAPAPVVQTWTISLIGRDAQAVTVLDENGALLADLDPVTLARLDQRNPMRVQRAWEVWRGTGRTLADWQDSTPPPLLPLAQTTPILFDTPKEWLNARIARRFDAMLAAGALDEARANLAGWNPDALSAKAIGAPELIAHLRGEMSLDAAREAATIATRQFAKRQRTWFRARMRAWTAYRPVPA